MKQIGVEALKSRWLFSTTGTHDLLFALIRFADQRAAPETLAQAKAQTAGAEKNISAYSGGQLKFSTATIKSVTLKHNLA